LAKRFAHKKQDVAKDFNFFVDGQEIKTVSQFRHLGRIVTDDDKDGATISRSISRARGKWVKLG